MMLRTTVLAFLLTTTASAFSVQPAHLSRTPTLLYADPDDVAPRNDENDTPSSSASSSTNDILNSPEFLKRKLDVLKSDIDKTEASILEAEQRLEAGQAEWGSQLADLNKEYQNIQKRMNTQSNQSNDMASSQVAREMLEVLDNFDRAFGQVTPSDEREETIANEYQGVYDNIMQVFSKLGIEEVQTVGAEFDYEVHQAVMQKPGTDYEEGIVCEEFQKGFKIGDTLIRAAMVAVAA